MRNRATRVSRRFRNWAVMCATSASTASFPNASAAAHCAMVFAPEVMCDCIAAIVLASSRGARQNPMRHPVIA